MKEDFLKAIFEKKLVKIIFRSIEKGEIERNCVPFDYGPSRRNLNPNPERYHFYDLDSPEGEHNLSLLPEQLISLKIIDKNFEPSSYVTWKAPYKWFISRDWGIYS